MKHNLHPTLAFRAFSGVPFATHDWLNHWFNRVMSSVPSLGLSGDHSGDQSPSWSQAETHQESPHEHNKDTDVIQEMTRVLKAPARNRGQRPEKWLHLSKAVVAHLKGSLFASGWKSLLLGCSILSNSSGHLLGGLLKNGEWRFFVGHLLEGLFLRCRVRREGVCTRLLGVRRCRGSLDPWRTTWKPLAFGIRTEGSDLPPQLTPPPAARWQMTLGCFKATEWKHQTYRPHYTEMPSSQRKQPKTCFSVGRWQTWKGGSEAVWRKGKPKRKSRRGAAMGPGDEGRFGSLCPLFWGVEG